MNLVNLEAVSKSYGPDPLLRAVSLGVHSGDRVGIVGSNGGGKSTLVRLLVGEDAPDAGRVTQASGLRVSLLAQTAALPPGATVRDVVVGDRPEHEWAGDAAARAVLRGLGLEDSLERVVDPMSGGERRRVDLARVLVERHDLLVLDEPTNHLDVEGIAWLAGHLARRAEAVVVVTHDRWFLDEVCTTTWEVVDGDVHQYEGGYSAYVLARAERSRQSAAREDRRQNLVRKELAWLRRGPPARTSKPSFRIDAANALIADVPPIRDSVELVRLGTARLGKSVVDLHDVSVSRGGRTLLDRVTWALGPGDRLGVVGVNGSGKSTLLKLLAGELRPDAGKVRTGQTVRAAHLDQEVRALPEELRVLAAVEDIAQRVDLAGGRSLTAAQLVERLGFPPARQWTPVADLSGGERRRLQVLRLLMAEPNVLLLDEPTNDLDVDTLTALEDLLDGWPGTLVVVSHDRWFLERTCDRVVALLGDGNLAELPGGVDDYLARRAAARSARPAAAPAGAGAAPAASRSGDARAARKELVRIERAMERSITRETALHDAMAAAATDHAEVLRLDTELRELLAERTRLEDEWLRLADEAEG